MGRAEGRGQARGHCPYKTLVSLRMKQPCPLSWQNNKSSQKNTVKIKQLGKQGILLAN